MVKPLSFKGDKKVKKRKRHDDTKQRAGDDGSALAHSAIDGGDGEAQLADDDSWVTAEAVTDLTGPVIFVLGSTSPPACLACDANGSVFASELENLIDGDAKTAEPHDVRQVWVATRIAGSDHVNFKGHHGKYLSADKFGVVSATREAVALEENFTPTPSPDTPGSFDIQTVRDTFLATQAVKKGLEVRGDVEEAGPATKVWIRMQARFKPTFKANKEEKAREKVSRRELEQAVGRRLEDDEVKRLKRARKDGSYYEAILDARVKGKHDKYS